MLISSQARKRESRGRSLQILRLLPWVPAFAGTSGHKTPIPPDRNPLQDRLPKLRTSAESFTCFGLIWQAPDQADCLPNRFLWHRPPLDQLDAGAPCIGDIGDRGAGRLVLPIGLIELDAFGFDLLDESLQVLHVEAYVVEHASFGWQLRIVGLGKPELAARDIRNGGIVPRACLGAEGLRIPSLALGDLGFRQEEVHVLMPDRHRLSLVFQDFN